MSLVVDNKFVILQSMLMYCIQYKLINIRATEAQKNAPSATELQFKGCQYVLKHHNINPTNVYNITALLLISLRLLLILTVA